MCKLVKFSLKETHADMHNGRLKLTDKIMIWNPQTNTIWNLCLELK